MTYPFQFISLQPFLTHPSNQDQPQKDYRIPLTFERSGLDNFGSFLDEIHGSGVAGVDDGHSRVCNNHSRYTDESTLNSDSFLCFTRGRIDNVRPFCNERSSAERFFSIPELFNMIMLQCLHHTTFPLPAVCGSWKVMYEGAPRAFKRTGILYTESILKLVLGHLEMKGLLAAELVCPVWQHAIADTAALQQKLFEAPSSSTTRYMNPAYSNRPSYHLRDNDTPISLIYNRLLVLTLLPPGHYLNAYSSPLAKGSHQHKRDLLEGLKQHMYMTQPPTKLVKFEADMVQPLYVHHGNGVIMKQYSDALGELSKLTSNRANYVRFSMIFYAKETDCEDFDAATGKRKLPGLGDLKSRHIGERD
jgi:hypothetical protein